MSRKPSSQMPVEPTELEQPTDAQLTPAAPANTQPTQPAAPADTQPALQAPKKSFFGMVLFLAAAVFLGFLLAHVCDGVFSDPQSSKPQQVQAADGTQEINEFSIIAHVPQAYAKVASDNTRAYYKTDDGRMICLCESLDAPLFIDIPPRLLNWKYLGFSDRAFHEMAALHEDDDESKTAGINSEFDNAIIITKHSNKSDPFADQRTAPRPKGAVLTYCFAKDGRCIITDAPADETAAILQSASFANL